MDISIKEFDGHNVAFIGSSGQKIESEQDALDLMANAGYLGAEAMIIPAENFSSEFFDLKTGLAGDILQKFSNYRMKLVIVGRFDHYHSQSLAAFIRESNRGNLIFFVPDNDTAIQYLLDRP